MAGDFDSRACTVADLSFSLASDVCMYVCFYTSDV